MSTLAIDVIEAKSGDIKAFERLINSTRNMVTSIALSIIKDVDASEEIAQQVYISCWQNLSTLKSETSFLPWIRQSTRYTAFNYMRDNKLSKRVSGDEADSLFAEFCSQEPTPDEDYDADTLKQLVAQLIDNLPNETREIVLLYYREDMSSKQVASLLSITEASVRKKLSRARTSLRKDALNKLGKAVFATAPTMTFTAMTLGNLTVSAPASAATGAAATGVTKWGWIFSGALLSSFLAAAIVFVNTLLPLKRMQSQDNKKKLVRLRNLTIGWIIISGLLLTAAYELTSGAIAPILVFSLFSVGLIILTKRSNSLILSDLKAQNKPWKWSFCMGYLGLAVGVAIGFAGLIIGLINAGRLVL